MLWLFLIAVGFIVYTYAVFPLWIHYRARGRHLPELSLPEDPEAWPTVSIVIAAHNERDTLPEKIQSLETLDYPADKTEWIVVSDGSTDGTDAWLDSAFASDPQRRFLHYTPARGKCGALNEGVSMAGGDIIVFMDARQRISADAIKALAPFLADERIGAVSGELMLCDADSTEGANVGLYWRYEKWIRDNESRAFSTTGVTGALYAIRRADFTPNRLGTLLDDFDTPVALLKQGKRTLFVPGALAFDQASEDLALEFRRKVRTLAGCWQSFFHHPWLFHPRKNPVWWQFISHKVFRLLVPFAMILALLSAFFGALAGQPFLQVMLVVQIAFYLLAWASDAELPGTNNKVLSFLRVFVRLNLAALIGTIRYFTQRDSISWK